MIISSRKSAMLVLAATVSAGGLFANENDWSYSDQSPAPKRVSGVR